MKKRIIIGSAVLGLLLFVILSAAVDSTKSTIGERQIETASSAGSHHGKAICCESHIPSRFNAAALPFSAIPVPGAAIAIPVAPRAAGAPAVAAGAGNAYPDAAAKTAHPGMVWIGGGAFMMGADNKQAMDDEYPKHKVTVDGFWMDLTE